MSETSAQEVGRRLGEAAGEVISVVNENAALRLLAAQLAGALEKASLLIEHGDFSNGVGEFGRDEGREGAIKWIGEIDAALAAYHAAGIHEEVKR